MKATNFTRHDCKLGKRRLSYDRITRDYRCEDCGARLARLHDGKWYAACGVPDCRSRNFIHEHELQRQKSEAIEVFSGLPREMQDLLQPERARLPKLPKDERGIFSLSPLPEVEL